MAAGYTDTPQNIAEILGYVDIDKDKIVKEMIQSSKCYFYDACSFRRHANLSSIEAEYFMNYVKYKEGIVVITRSILMELASHSGVLNQEYIEYIQHMKAFGITVLLIYEEDILSVMEICFSTNAVINEYLCWAVRMIKSPVSTIADTLQGSRSISNEVIKGRNLDHSGVYKDFFGAVRNNKVSGDNLGEELLAICLHILSYIPGEKDGKFCVVTDDKGAASKIDAMFKKTAKIHLGKRIGIFSTPKLVQILYRENILQNHEHMKEILEVGTEGNIVVLGRLIYDLRGREISLNAEELTDLITEPNGIEIIF